MAIEKFRALSWNRTASFGGALSSPEAAPRVLDIEFNPSFDIQPYEFQKGGHYDQVGITANTDGTPGGGDRVFGSTLTFKTYLTEIGDGTTAVANNASLNTLLFYQLLGGEFTPASMAPAAITSDVAGSVVLTGTVESSYPDGGAAAFISATSTDSKVVFIKNSAESGNTTLTLLYTQTDDLSTLSATAVPASTFYIKDTNPSTYIAFEVIGGAGASYGSTYDDVLQLTGCQPTEVKITFEAGMPPMCEWTIAVGKYTRAATGSIVTSSFSGGTIPVTVLNSDENDPLPCTNLPIYFSADPGTNSSWSAADFQSVEITISCPQAAKESIFQSGGISAFEKNGFELTVTAKPYATDTYETYHMKQTRLGMAIWGPSTAAVTGNGQKWAILMPALVITEPPTRSDINGILAQEITMKGVYSTIEGTSAASCERNGSVPTDSEFRIHFL